MTRMPATVPTNHNGILPVVPTLDIFSTPLKSSLEILAQNTYSHKKKKIQ
jgi:hypothetical protein